MDHDHQCQRKAGVLVQTYEQLLSVGAEDLKHAQHHREADRHHESQRQPEGQFPAQVHRISQGCFFKAQEASQSTPVGLVQAASVTPCYHNNPRTDDKHRGKANVHHESVAVNLLAKQQSAAKAGNE